MRKLFNRTLLVALVALTLTACLGGGGATDRQTLLSGGSWPGVTVEGETIYMAYNTQVTAINSTGQAVWSFPQDPGGGQNATNFFATPTIADDLLLAGDYTDTLYALNKETGTEVWSFTSLDRGRFIASATVVDGTVYIPDVAGYLYALDVETGELLWDFQAERDIWTTPIVEDGVIYVTSLDRHVYAVNAENGEQLWQFPDANDPTEENDIGAMVSPPAYYDGILYFSTLDNLLIALNVDEQRIIWEYEIENWLWSQPAIVEDEGLLIAGDLNGNVVALDLLEGTESWVFEAGGPVVGAPLIAERDGQQVAYIASEDTNVYTLAVENGDPIAAPAEIENEFTARFLLFQTGQENRPVPIYASPVLFDEVLLLGMHQGNSTLRAYDRDTLLPRWSYTPEQ